MAGYPVALAARSPAIGTAWDLFRSISRWRGKKKFVPFRILKKGFLLFRSHLTRSFHKVLSSGSIFLREVMAPLGSCLVSALASTSDLIGKTTLEVFPSYKEKGKLFFIAVAQHRPRCWQWEGIGGSLKRGHVCGYTFNGQNVRLFYELHSIFSSPAGARKNLYND